MSGQENWEDVQGGLLVKWDAPKTIEGVLRGGKEVSGQFGKQMRYTLLQADNTLLDFYAPAILARQLLDPRITVGVRIQIEYTGGSVTTKSGRIAKEFVVRVAK